MAKRKHDSRSSWESRDRIQAVHPPGHWLLSIGMVVGGCLALAFTLQSILGSELTATLFFSSGTWLSIVTSLGAQAQVSPAGQPEFFEVAFFPLFSILTTVSVVSLIGFLGGARLKSKTDPSPDALSSVAQTGRVCVSGWRWWLLPWFWELARIFAFASGFETVMVLMTSMFHYVIAISLAGWVTELAVSLMSDTTAAGHGRELDPTYQRTIYRVSVTVLVGLAAYAGVFVVMNWQLYRGLLVPHGDSAMYEEHLWNVLHGKGFRSYLDPGLFLGEHIQVVHLALLPIYAIWPSHLLLELCESVALASGAIPVFWIARRWSASVSSASCLALAYLLYSPLQFLDIAIDLKTFRPICFGVPAVLFALDQLERGRIKSTAVLFLIALLSKEDFVQILAPLGFWIAAQPFLQTNQQSINRPCPLPEFLLSRKSALQHGIGLVVVSVGYLLLTTQVLIPLFRDGAEPHYARYYSRFGASMGEIIRNMITQPALLIEELATISSIGYVLALLVPLALLPIFSLSRFCVAVPILVLLCLNEIVKSDPQPHHHFHAPVVPVLFWAAAHSLHKFRAGFEAKLPGLFGRVLAVNQRFVAVFALTVCCFTGATVGTGPLTIRFWDRGSFFHWQKLYVPSERAEQFDAVLDQIPSGARVASTDFVHPRFTHHERSYDYSHYSRKVAAYEHRVPDDTDFIVIDTQHYYSDIKSPDEVRELQTEPEKWQLLEDRTNGYFIILKRRE